MTFLVCKQKEVEFICYGKKVCIFLVMAQLLILLKDHITLNNLKTCQYFTAVPKDITWSNLLF